MELAEKRRPGGTCTFAKLADVMPPDDYEIVCGWLDSHTIESEQIARSLRKAGHQVAGNTVARHRRGDCLCGAL